MFFVDGHCDTITKAMDKKEKLLKNTCHIDIEKMRKFNAPVQIFSVWLNKEKLSKAFYNTMTAVDFFKKEVEKNNKYIAIAKNYYELTQNIKYKKISGILGVEGGEAFEGKEENIYKLFNEGVRVFTVTWNNENELGFGALTDSEKGLKPFGKTAVELINELGGIIDVSHINEKGFWDICETSNKAFIASHSNAKKICNSKRNLSDEQIKEISKRKGVIGINLYSDFLSENGIADINDVIRVADYIMEVGGENVLTMGCDFDGIDKMPVGINDVSDIDILYNAFEKNFGRIIAEKIIGKNFFEFFEKHFI